MPNLLDPLGLFERDAKRVSRAVAGGMTGNPDRPAQMSHESLWGLTRAQLDTFAPQIADDWERREMIPIGTRGTVREYLREIARRMHGTSPPF